MPNELSVSVASRHDAAAWDAFVNARGDETGYHAWDWRRVFGDAFGHEAIYLVARRGPVIVGVLPLVLIKSVLFGNSLTSLPFLNYGGVLADDAASALALAEAAREQARTRKCRHVELRHVGR